MFPRQSVVLQQQNPFCISSPNIQAFEKPKLPRTFLRRFSSVSMNLDWGDNEQNALLVRVN